MKIELLELIKELREDEVVLEDNPVVFHWSYSEEPNIKFSLLIDGTGTDVMQQDSRTIN